MKEFTITGAQDFAETLPLGEVECDDRLRDRAQVAVALKSPNAAYEE